MTALQEKQMFKAVMSGNIDNAHFAEAMEAWHREEGEGRLLKYEQMTMDERKWVTQRAQSLKVAQ